MPIDPVQYRVMFDAVAAGYRQWWFPLIGVLISVAALWFYLVERSSGWGSLGRALSFTVLVFGGVWCVAAFVWTHGNYLRLKNALISGRYELVEGRISEFVAGDQGDHRPETFKVGDRRFSYTPSALTPGYSTTRPHGGVLRDGLRVRIAAVDGAIARLEVAAGQH
jgi:hypothetical protein